MWASRTSQLTGFPMHKHKETSLQTIFASSWNAALALGLLAALMAPLFDF
jgi:hypothetical protein